MSRSLHSRNELLHRDAKRADGVRSIVRVKVRDQLGLLSALCRWFATHDANIESLHARTASGMADDTFLVVGHVDGDELAGNLER